MQDKAAMPGIPDLIDNRKRKLADVLLGVLDQSREPGLDVVTAFFNLKGLEAIGPKLDALARLRLLLGKQQEQEFLVGQRLLAQLEDAAARGETTASEIGRWRNFFAQDCVEVRWYAKTFCHGKAYIVHGVPTLEAVGIVGSSNLTGGGLTSNLELNAVLKQTAAVRDLQAWFDDLWSEAEDYKAELLKLLERFTRSYTPYEIYIKIIYEALRDKLDQELAEQDEKPSPIALADFQHDGYLAAREILENYGGVLIADSVGLGKTYLALRLLDDYAYRERQTALIVCPAAVSETIWRPLLQQHGIPHEIVSMERVSRRDFPVGQYARFRVIVLDESHNFRNPDTNRWPNLFRVITQGEPDKKIILLTATPVNNTVFDLYHQLSLITRDDRKALLSAGISDLWEYFRRAEQNKEALYEVLEALAVRRSRQFIRQQYPDAEIDGQPLRFPERELHTVQYSLKRTYGPGLYRKLAQTIEGLLLAPYQVEIYRREVVEARKGSAKQLVFFEGEQEQSDSAVRRLQDVLGWSREDAHDFLMSVGRQVALAHIMRVLYLKRLESSIEALRVSLGRLRGFLTLFLKALHEGRLLQAEDYRKWLQAEAADETEAEDSFDLEQFVAGLPELPADRYDLEALRAAVMADLHALEAVLAELEREHPDGKLDVLKALLTSRDLAGKKVVLFAYFKDTARYIYRTLRSDRTFLGRLGHVRIDIVDSDVKPAQRNERIVRFAPRANGKPDLAVTEQIDLLISTDVLSEGQNLQDAEAVVNYDLHWNPVRMVQRVGRLDRIGSPHTLIHVYNFFPEEELDEILGLLDRLRKKLDAINRTVGLDASILGETPNPLDFNVLRRIAREDKEVLDDLEAQSELAIGEFLKQDLLRFLKELGEEDLKRIPLGMGTARKRAGGPSGFFAAFRNPQTNQHHWLFLSEDGRVVDRRLEAIRFVRCGPDEPTETLPEGYDPRPSLRRLRKHLWNQIRRAAMATGTLPAPQRQIVNWLHALPPSAERNSLLAYFEAAPVAGPGLKELRRLWRDRSSVRQDEWTKQLGAFVRNHPRPQAPGASSGPALAPESEEGLDCIAWMKVI
ncbi:MAG: hypothetical protein KatS3mg015_3123 [Fimbriimonadales bacterium]|nr:MAG: hypothetical protein KatS3mg015_3123 [Fimbriimonadales bacterium]